MTAAALSSATVQTETATLIAVLAAPIAVLAGVAALAVVLLARSGRGRLVRGRQRLDRATPALEEELASARISLDRLRATSAVMATRGREADVRLAAMTDDLASGRASIQAFSRGRLAPAVRAVQLAGALARVALLWRMPAR